MPFQDLPPRKDPKGGSPKTPPGGVPLRDYQYEYPQEQTPQPIVIHNGNGGIWRAIATGLGGLVVGLLIAWFTAFRERGVTRVEMEEYTRQTHVEMEQHVKDSMPRYITRADMEEYTSKYSPWSMDKQFIISRLSGQDQQIGELRTKIDLATKVIETQKR